MSKTISSSYSSGITLTNASYNPVLVTGTIDATTGSALYGATPTAWSITNQGTVETGDATAVGITLGAGGNIDNTAAGLISGYGGVYVSGGAATVTNAGTVDATGAAVAFAAGYNNRLIDDPGAVFQGAVNGGNKVGGPFVTTLELASGASAGTLSGLGTQFVGFGRVTVDSGAHWAWTSSSTVEADATLTNSGLLTGRVNLGAGVTVANHGTMRSTAGVVAYASSIDPNVSINNTGVILNTGGTSSAVSLRDGASVSNASGGTIAGGGHSGVYIGGQAGTVLNSGLITGDGTTMSPGVAFFAGGFVSNASTGTISSTYSTGIYMEGAAGTVINAGSIVNFGTAGGAGIDLIAGGTVSNLVGGTINSPNRVGVYISGGAAMVVNAGLIESGGTHFAVVLANGGSVTNQSGGTIVGAQRLAIDVTGTSAGTVMNDGTIMSQGNTTGSSGIVFDAGGYVSNGSHGLITSASRVGVYATGGSLAVVNAGSIGSGSTHSAVYDIGGASSSVLNSGHLTGGANGVDLRSGGSVTNTSGGTITGGTGVAFGTAAGTVANGGLIDGTSGVAVFFSTGFANELIVDPGAAFVGNVNGGNFVGSSVVSTLELASGASAGSLSGVGEQFNNFGDINFDTGAQWFVSGNQGGFAGTLNGFAQHDTVEMTGFTATGSSFSGGVLTMTGTGTVTTATLAFAGSFSLSDFDVTSAAGNTDVTLNEVCFLAGTRIATPDGEVPVERLAIGDKVLTLRGEARPITWIGTGRVLAPRGGRVASAAVIVRKGALADNVPHGDLRVTKGHSLFIDGVLIPVEFLINHHSILWDEQAREVTVYHVELETHDVLIADGAPAESYRDDGNRWLFRNANTGWNHPPREPCARVLTRGPVVDSIWRRLRDRAGSRTSVLLTHDPDLHLLVDGTRIDPFDRDAARCVFRLGGRPRIMRIRSRSAAPLDLGIARDPRVLGVAIRRIVMAQARRQRMIEASAASLTDGYHGFEPDVGYRWTDGDAAVPPELFAGMHGPGTLILDLGATMQYVDQRKATKAA